MLTLCINHNFAYEMECVVRIFHPGYKITVDRECREVSGALATTWLLDEGARQNFFAKVRIGSFEKAVEKTTAGLSPQECEWELARMLFQLFCEQAGRRPAWGILTGIRPVRLYHSLLAQGMDETAAESVFRERYLVSEKKIRLVIDTGKQEQLILDRNDPNGFSLYISIPFCPSRCLYCSFVSHDIEKAAKLVPAYIECLCKELEEIGHLAKALGLNLQSVYIGGGTPTTLTATQLEQVLSTVDKCFDKHHLLEYTVEAGRPDTITAKKLEVLRRWGVDRISVNPQTMNDELLNGIGRRHTSEQIVESYQLVRQAGFRAVNMDLIAGLPGETPESYCSTMERVLAMRPENITVHTLTVKRSSALREREDAFAEGELDVSTLLDQSRRGLSAQGYRPYYLYRQKGTVQNLENVGYSLPGFEGVYNVFIMEEVHTVLAAGAGATTKLYAHPDRLKRVYNYKFPYEYIGRFDEMIARKAMVKEFYEKH